MLQSAYDSRSTALLLVDPYNDFLSEGGKIWPRVQAIAEEVGLIENLKSITRAARSAGIRVFIVPHRRWEPGDYESWRHPNPTQRAIMQRHSLRAANGAGSGIPIWLRSPATSSSKSIGHRAASPTPTSTSSSSSMASAT